MANDFRITSRKDENHDQKPFFSVQATKTFFNEVKIEFNKISWPDKKHTVASSGVVVVLVMIISIYLASVDLVVGKLIGSVLK